MNPLHAICPYFAMFPEDFVRKPVDSWTNRGDLILGPFSGPPNGTDIPIKT